MKEIDMQDKVNTKPLDLGTHFDVTKHIRLVPLFQKKKLTNIFSTLKKLLKIKLAKRALDLASAERCNWQSS